MTSFGSFFGELQQFLPLLGVFEKIKADLTDSDTAIDKVADVFEDLIPEAVMLVGARNPALAAQASELGAFLVEQLQKWTDNKTATPPPPPPPPPSTADPTAVRYATQSEAQQHATAQNPNVLKYADGQFGVWPQVQTPVGATVVWTLPAA